MTKQHEMNDQTTWNSDWSVSCFLWKLLSIFAQMVEVPASCHQGPQLILGGTDLAIRQLQKKPKRFQEVEGLTGRKDDGEVVSSRVFLGGGWQLQIFVLCLNPENLGKMITHFWLIFVRWGWNHQLVFVGDFLTYFKVRFFVGNGL